MTASWQGLGEDLDSPFRYGAANSTEQDPSIREDIAGPLRSLDGTLIRLRWKYGGVAELGEHCGGGKDSVGEGGGNSEEDNGVTALD